MGSTRKQPVNFRKEELEAIAKCWSGATSAALVGIGSVGKSNLLQHLDDPEVQKHYIGDKAAKFKTIIVDANMLGPLPADRDDPVRCWAGYELMMHRLFLAFYPFEMLTNEEAKQFFDTYQALQDGTNPLFTYMALRYFELGLEYFMRKGYTIAFMFDEFDEMLRQLPVKFFQTLRGIRDSNKRQLMYITLTRSPLVTLVERFAIPVLDIEPFTELFTDNTIYVGPYNDTDGRAMLSELARRRQRSYSDNVNGLLLDITGRYAGILRVSVNSLDEFVNVNLNALSRNQLLEALAVKPAVRAECRTIWSSLNRSEQQVLKAVARLSAYNVNPESEFAVHMLLQKGILKLDESGQKLEILPPLFHMYVQSNPDFA
ncbi:MAG: hypothetical protein IPK17_23040 [Chloroflexi bacterium]|uniref:hypothetical protein n=1 Tax=Candidatus Flexifilum breve TaxID=3140694 RepID=UPI0031371926|nr:hypothetical protein [Chloroflexota bacterium]